MIPPSLEDAVGVDDLIAPLLPQQAKVVHEAIGNEHLDDDAPDDSGGSNDDTDEVLVGAERNQLECFATALDDEELQTENANDNRGEEIVIEYV